MGTRTGKKRLDTARSLATRYRTAIKKADHYHETARKLYADINRQLKGMSAKDRVLYREQIDKLLLHV